MEDHVYRILIKDEEHEIKINPDLSSVTEIFENRLKGKDFVIYEKIKGNFINFFIELEYTFSTRKEVNFPNIEVLNENINKFLSQKQNKINLESLNSVIIFEIESTELKKCFRIVYPELKVSLSKCKQLAVGIINNLKKTIKTGKKKTYLDGYKEGSEHLIYTVPKSFLPYNCVPWNLIGCFSDDEFLYDKDADEFFNIEDLFMNIAGCNSSRGEIIEVKKKKDIFATLYKHQHKNNAYNKEWATKHILNKSIKKSTDSATFREQLFNRMNKYFIIVPDRARNTIKIWSREKFKNKTVGWSTCSKMIFEEKYFLLKATFEEEHPETGKVEKKTISMFDWIKWPGRNECSKAIFKPYNTKLPEDSDEFNIAPAYAMNYDDVKEYIENMSYEDYKYARQELANILLSHLYRIWCFEDIEKFSFLLYWISFNLQQPEQKVKSALYVWTDLQGTGKSMIIEFFLQKIFGDDITQSTPSFNDILGDATHVNPCMLKGISVEEGRISKELYDRFKQFVTGDESRTRNLFEMADFQRSFSFLIFSNNSPDLICREDPTDRRIFELNCDQSKQKNADYFNNLDLYLKEESTPYIFAWLLYNIKIPKNFNMGLDPPVDLNHYLKEMEELDSFFCKLFVQGKNQGKMGFEQEPYATQDEKALWKYEQEYPETVEEKADPFYKRILSFSFLYNFYLQKRTPNSVDKNISKQSFSKKFDKFMGIILNGDDEYKENPVLRKTIGKSNKIYYIFPPRDILQKRSKKNSNPANFEEKNRKLDLLPDNFIENIKQFNETNRFIDEELVLSVQPPSRKRKRDKIDSIDRNSGKKQKIDNSEGDEDYYDLLNNDD